jgi:peroxiredoxin
MTKTHLRPGDSAPDFTLKSYDGKEVKLSDYRGKKNVVLAFYTGCFTGPCTTQIKNYQNDLARFEAAGAQILGVSTDTSFTQKAWAESMGRISFPLLSDFHPQGEVARRYGIYQEDGLNARVIFVIGKEGKIKFIQDQERSVVPDNMVTLEALKKA